MPIDNGNLNAKLELRRHFLGKYHVEAPPRVIDCCAGTGQIWNCLRQEFAVASYFPLDLKAKRGRLKLDSRRLLGQPGWKADVVDIDTYGSPWKHWQEMLPFVPNGLTVFLTLGVNTAGTRMNPGSLGADMLGMPEQTPAVLKAKMASKTAVNCWLTRCCDYGLMLVEALEAVGGGTARYFGVRLEKEPAAATAGSQHSNAGKERRHV